MNMFEYVFQDTRLIYKKSSFIHNCTRYFLIPSYNILVNYRLCQYVRNSRWGCLIGWYFRYRLRRKQTKFLVDFDDCLECGPGLFFPHNGPFVINGHAKIGKRCTIHPNVLIGGDRGKGVPIIGDYVFIGNGAKIIGDVKVGDWVFISPAAVVTKDIPSGAVVGAGLNKILSNNGKEHVNMYL